MDISYCNLQFGVHVSLHCVIVRVCWIFGCCSRPFDSARALSPPALELARFRSPEEERAARVLEICAVTVQRSDSVGGQRGASVEEVVHIPNHSAAQRAQPFLST